MQFSKSSIISILSLFVILSQAAFLSAQQAAEPYLTHHEQRVFNALDNLDKDFNAFRNVFDKNALVVFTFNDGTGNSITKSGTFDEVIGSMQAVTSFKVKWEPITNTHPNHPDRGVFSTIYYDYGLAENGCEALFSGIGTIRFSKDGMISDWRSFSTESLDFINCIDANYLVKEK